MPKRTLEFQFLATKAPLGGTGSRATWFFKHVVLLKPYESLSRSDLRLLNTSILDASLLIFCISSFSLAFVLAYLLHLLFNKTPVNMQPLSPSFFYEIATHSTNFRIFGLFCVRLCFVRLFAIFVDSTTPQNIQNHDFGPIWDRFAMIWR